MVSSHLAKILYEFILMHVECLTHLVILLLVFKYCFFLNYDAANMLVQANRLELLRWKNMLDYLLDN